LAPGLQYRVVRRGARVHRVESNIAQFAKQFFQDIVFCNILYTLSPVIGTSDVFESRERISLAREHESSRLQLVQAEAAAGDQSKGEGHAKDHADTLCASLALADSLLRVIAKPELGVQMIARSAFIARDPLYLVCDAVDQGLSFSLFSLGFGSCCSCELFARFVILAIDGERFMEDQQLCEKMG
jgi:hypothetical protein